jgi:hypothetical protein
MLSTEKTSVAKLGRSSESGSQHCSMIEYLVERERPSDKEKDRERGRESRGERERTMGN